MAVSRGSRQQLESAAGGTVVLAVLVAILILSLWLHFIVAHQNELIGREIQAQTETLERIERQNMALRRQVAATWAEPVMAERARALGYTPQQPLYLLLSQPLVPAARDTQGTGLLVPTSALDEPAGNPSDTVAGVNVAPSTSSPAGQP